MYLSGEQSETVLISLEYNFISRLPHDASMADCMGDTCVALT